MTGRNPDPFIGFSYSVIMQYYGCVSVKDIITKSLDVLTIVVPPALPAKVQNGSCTVCSIQYVYNLHTRPPHDGLFVV